MKPILLTVLALAATAFFGACLPTTGTRSPSWVASEPQAAEPDSPDQQRRIFFPCTMTASVNPAKRAFAAIVLSLKEQQWSVARMDPQRNAIDASRCYRDNPELCVWTAFQCDAQGQVSVKPGHTPERIRDDLAGWLVALERSFNNCKCYTDAVLREEMGKYGIAY